MFKTIFSIFVLNISINKKSINENIYYLRMDTER